MKRQALWAAVVLVAGAGCTVPGEESVSGRATQGTTPKTVLRVPLVDEDGKPFARFNEQIRALGMEELPAFVDVASGETDTYWKLSQRIEDAAAQITEMKESWGGSMPGDYPGICFVGDPDEVTDLVGSLTDSFFSDQLGIIGSKYGKNRWIGEDDEEWESEYGDEWAHWDPLRPEVLIMAVSNDDGDDVTPNVVPPCGATISCDSLDDQAMDLCIPDDSADTDVWNCVTTENFAEGHAAIELQKYARTCCGADTGRLWCEDMPACAAGTPGCNMGPAVHGEKIDLPPGISASEGFLGRMKVTVTGGDRFSDLGLARTLTEGQRIFGESCDGVPTGDEVSFSENASVSTFIGFHRAHTSEWTSKMSPAEIDALEQYLTGVGVEKFRVFYGNDSGEVCAGSGEVNYNLLWNVETDDVLYLVLYPYSE